MKRITYLKKRKRNKNFVKNNEKLIILTFMFIVGLLCGAIANKTSNINIHTNISEMTENYIFTRSSQSILLSIFNYSFTDVLFVLLSGFLGLSILGQAIIYVIPIIRGMGLGIIVSYIFKTYSINGLLYSVLFIIVPAIVTVMTMLVSCKENILCSSDISSSLFRTKQGINNDFIKMFLVRNLILIIIIIVSSLFSGVISYFLINKISLC